MVAFKMKTVMLYNREGDVAAVVRIPDNVFYEFVVWNQKIFVWSNADQRYRLSVGVSIGTAKIDKSWRVI